MTVSTPFHFAVLSPFAEGNRFRNNFSLLARYFIVVISSVSVAWIRFVFGCTILIAVLGLSGKVRIVVELASISVRAVSFLKGVAHVSSGLFGSWNRLAYIVFVVIVVLLLHLLLIILSPSLLGFGTGPTPLGFVIPFGRLVVFLVFLGPQKHLATVLATELLGSAALVQHRGIPGALGGRPGTTQILVGFFFFKGGQRIPIGCLEGLDIVFVCSCGVCGRIHGCCICCRWLLLIHGGDWNRENREDESNPIISLESKKKLILV